MWASFCIHSPQPRNPGGFDEIDFFKQHKITITINADISGVRPPQASGMVDNGWWANNVEK